MLNLKRSLAKTRLMRALTGLGMEEFNKLLDAFTLALLESKPLARQRKRRPGGGRKHTLPTPAEKLFFILLYVKCYPTFDVLGFMFRVDRAQPCRWVGEYLPLLAAALGREVVLPERQITSVEEFVRLFPQIREVWLDGSERPIQRPKDRERQRANYSGKKKRHTRKNILMSDKQKRILFLAPTQEGRMHDKTCATEAGLFSVLPPGVPIRADLAFLGIDREHPQLTLMLPKKKPKHQELSAPDKEYNREQAKRRIIAEHSIGGVKRLRAVTDVFRNHREQLDDQILLVSCGLWNLHLKQSA